MINRYFRTLCFITLSFFSALACGEAMIMEPGQQVRQTVEQILRYVDDQSLDQSTRRQKIVSIIRARFDVLTMSRSILATQWKSATGQQQERFIELFQRLLEKTYITAIESYTNEKVEYGKVKQKDKRALVETFIVNEARKIPVNYKMRLKQDGWYAYDVIIEGVGIVNNYRGSFRAIIKKQGMDGLLQSMENKAREI